MKLREAVVIAALCAMSMPAAAMQDPQETPSRQKPPAAKPDAAKPPDQAPEPPPRRPPVLDTNVMIEVSISDQTGAAAPERKVVSMTAADSTMGRIRSQTLGVNAILNVDARPRVQSGNRILLELTVEYTPGAPESGAARDRRGNLHESLTVLLQDGKPQVISHAADPFMDRKMSVEVKATILK